ncbi:MAG TPA: hypothetical protein VN577_23845 [Terriglobales bacterium]|nr:hypothetical protein [Terriglobales bacterium]
MSLIPPESAVIATLVHNLRQPLSTIETCAFFLRMVLDGTADPRVSENLELIERQIAEAQRILLAAGVQASGESHCLMKAESAGGV